MNAGSVPPSEPSPHPAWRGAAAGAVAAAVGAYALSGWFTGTGLGRVLDAGLGAAVGVVAVAIGTLVAAFLLRLLVGRVPGWPWSWNLGAAGALLLLGELPYLAPSVPDLPYLVGAGLILVAQALAGTGVWLLRDRGTSEGDPGPARRAAQVGAGSVLILLGLAIDVALVAWLLWPGPGAPPVEALAGADAAAPAALSAPDPSSPGPHEIRRLTYGSGVGHRRPEYGPEADLRTPTVDGSRIIPAWDGFDARMREWYWGFSPDSFPLNGRVWYPADDTAEGSFPLVLVVHGNHAMQDWSDPGYAYLGELLASRGFITVSVDENFVNANWSGDFGGREMAARAWLLLEHLRQWRRWARTPGNPFHGRVDMDRIALVGHSRGGEAVAIAAAFNDLPRFPDDGRIGFDYGFGIRAVVALAPTDRRYHRRMGFDGASYLVLHGSWDSDEPSFEGVRQWERVRLDGDGEAAGTVAAGARDALAGLEATAGPGPAVGPDAAAGRDAAPVAEAPRAPGSTTPSDTATLPAAAGAPAPVPRFRAAVYVHRANHGQFNTGWGRRDYGLPGGWLLNTRPILPPDAQRRVAKVFIAAFLETTLRERRAYLPLFRDPRVGRPWLPATPLVSRYRDAEFRPLATFQEDPNLSTGTAPGVTVEARGFDAWEERELHFRDGDPQGNDAVVLRWGAASPEETAGRAELEADPERDAGDGLAAGRDAPGPGPVYELRLPPDGVRAGTGDVLTLSVARLPLPRADRVDAGDTEDGGAGEGASPAPPALGIQVELEDGDGTRVSAPLADYGLVPPRLPIQLFKLPYLTEDLDPSETLLHTLRVSLGSLAASDPAFDLASLAAVRLRADGAAAGGIVLDDLGFAPGGSAAARARGTGR